MQTPMARTWMAALTLALAGSGCSGSDLKGHYWNVTVTGLQDDCTGAQATYSEKFEYRVKIDGQDVEVAVGPDVFATGTANGCFVAYESVVWSESVAEANVRWILSGSATISMGDGSCRPANGTDWDGTEIFEVVNSETPEMSPGCEYSMQVSGKYQGETK